MRRAAIPLLVLALGFSGCFGGSHCIGGQEGEDLSCDGPGGDTGTADTDSGDTDSDTDTDADTDVDSGDVDTSVDGGTHYVGAFVVDATAADGTRDRCSGTVAVTVSAGEATGAGACTFVGPLAAAHPDGLGAAILGAVAEDETASGTVRFTIGAAGELPWTGTAGAALNGAFAGSLKSSATTLTVTGTFTGAPE